MSTAPLTAVPPHPPAPPPADAPTRGYWSEAWRQYKKRKMSVVALIFVVFLIVVAIFAPAIAGTKPVVVRYKGHYYFPAMSYFKRSWENPIFYKDRFRQRFPQNLKEKDPDHWAIWPLVFQDPMRRVQENEWPGQPANPTADKGRPSQYNLFGTDQQGKDVFAQMVHGTTIALLVGFVSMGIAATIGIAIGALAGYFGGWIDTLVSRFIEVVMCIPTLVLILSLLAFLKQVTIWHLMAVIGCTGWTTIARLTRAEFLKLRTSDFVIAAKSIGAGRWRIMFRHILPNALAPVMAPISFGVATAILTESGLSFLGFGDPTSPSWGKLLTSGRTNLNLWWLVVFPGAAIFLAVLAYNLIGEGLQDATNPRLRDSRK